MARRAFIVGAYIPNGGTLMAYDVGRILHHDFGYSPVAVATGDHGPDNGIFHYPDPFPSIGIDEMLGVAEADDILLCNPSFSNNGFGLRFPGRKIMYVQDFKTFSLLDLYFDHYVSVSTVVRDFLKRTYGLKTGVIPAYVSLPEAPTPPWRERDPDRILVHVKGRDKLSQTLAEEVRAIITARHPSARLEPLGTGEKTSHAALLARIGSARTLLSLVPAEGFGLTPLEAMGAGTAVCGLDGIAGRDYMRPGRNAMVTRYGPVADIAETALTLLASPARAETIAAAGRRTAQRYLRPVFVQRWRKALTAMGVRPVNGSPPR
ncbi:glycosyltransferase [Acuticoccus sp. M5D2P5]|uniref:glycosyltransferase family protein n=1 Tax=Acuticoccus kalidii TaxID=2910977 RepID=UPI001F26F96F|nr:glycosyltransferase [Acuticoccus kalidii]MCF3936484.1 glycosyltransferase [Acuticoccus kalidii]